MRSNQTQDEMAEGSPPNSPSILDANFGFGTGDDAISTLSSASAQSINEVMREFVYPNSTAILNSTPIQNSSSFLTNNLDYSPITLPAGLASSGEPQPSTSFGARRALFQDTDDDDISFLTRSESGSISSSQNVTPRKNLSQASLHRYIPSPAPSDFDGYEVVLHSPVPSEASQPLFSTPPSQPSPSKRGRFNSNPSPRSAPVRKKQRVPPSSTEMSTPTRRGRQIATPTRTPRINANRSANDSGFANDLNDSTSSPSVEESNGDSDDSGEYSDEEMDPATEKDTIDPFSIHRIRVHHLPEDIQGNPRLPEINIIEKMMVKINAATKGFKYAEVVAKLKRRRESNSATVLSTPDSPDEETPPPPEPQPDSTFGYQIAAYIQTQRFYDKHLLPLGIKSLLTRNNKLLFYYRPAPSEIFVVTFGQTWHAIQPYCCPQFSFQISGRLTNHDGCFQEALKSLTGIVRTRTTTLKDASLSKGLNIIGYNWLKEFRSDASIYRLREFGSRQDIQTRKIKGNVKIRFGLGYVRINKKLNLLNFPEILNHFSRICRNKMTFKFPSGAPEEQLDHFPPLLWATVSKSRDADEALHKVMFSFMKNSNSQAMQEFEFCHKHTEDFSLASKFKLEYIGRGKKYPVRRFPKCPTAMQVFASLRQGCPELTDSTDVNMFTTRLKNCRLSYHIRGHKKEEEKVFNFVEGVVPLETDYFWKTMGIWCVVRDEYHVTVHSEFVKLLKKDGILFDRPEAEGALSKKWLNEMATVGDYVKAYESVAGYFYPEPVTPPEISSQESESQDEEENSDPGKNYMFDLMHVIQRENGEKCIYLYYIFERFNAGIRDASTRIDKSLNILFREPDRKVVTPPVTDSSSQDYFTPPENAMFDGSTAPVTDVKSPLEAFFDSQRGSAEFAELFPSWAEFYEELVKEKVFIVVAFRTTKMRRDMGDDQETNRGTLFQHFRRMTTHEDKVEKTFYKEKNLEETFSVENIQFLVVSNLEPGIKREICRDLEIESDNHRVIASKILDALVDKGYCSGDRKAVTGKLLKLRQGKELQLFSNINSNALNVEVFKLIQPRFLSQFPGFIHKLECFEIHKRVVRDPRLVLKFTEIPVQMEESPGPVEITRTRSVVSI